MNQRMICITPFVVSAHKSTIVCPFVFVCVNVRVKDSPACTASILRQWHVRDPVDDENVTNWNFGEWDLAERYL